MNNTYEKAKDEFSRMEAKEYPCPDERPVVLEFKDEILAIVKKFGESGQSGGSAPFTAGIISQAVKKLCMHEPLGGIDDVPEDWNEIEHGVFQHRRNSAVFKDEDGTAHFLYAIVWQGEDEWDSFTGHVEGVGSAQNVKSWPFVGKTFKVDVVRERNDSHHDRVTCGDGDYLYRIKDRKQLDAVWEYYNQRNH